MPPQRPINFLDRETEKVQPKTNRAIFFILCLVLLVAITGFVQTKYGSPQNNLAYDPITLEPVEPNSLFDRLKNFIFSRDKQVKGQDRDRVNILITGQGGPGHDGPFLTDTILLMSVKPSSGQVAFISIPRDLEVEIPEHGARKVNHANAFGEIQEQGQGPELSKTVLEQTLDEQIDYYARVDFQAFEEVIDELGGLEIAIERSFVDREYPAANHEYQVVSFQKGEQVLDGDQSLKFVRSRHGNNGEGSDFARSKRQQKVILALKDQLLSGSTLTSPQKIKGILDSLQSHVVTNIRFTDLVALMKLAKEADTSSIITLPLDDSPEGFLRSTINNRGEFVLRPVDGDFQAIHLAVEHIFSSSTAMATISSPNSAVEIQEPILDPNQPETEVLSEGLREQPSEEDLEPVSSPVNIEIQNGTFRTGLAGRTKNKLTQADFTVPTVGNAAIRPVSNTIAIILTNELKSANLELLEQTLSLPELQTTLPSGFQANAESDILIILGEDFVE